MLNCCDIREVYDDNDGDNRSNNNEDNVIAFSKPALHSVGWAPVARQSMWDLFRHSHRCNQYFSFFWGGGSKKAYPDVKGKKGKVHLCTGTEALYRPYGP